VGIRFKCVCGKSLRVGDEHAGKRVKCPECGQLLAVPEAPADDLAGLDEGAAVERVAPPTLKPSVSPPEAAPAPANKKPLLLLGSLAIVVAAVVVVVLTTQTSEPSGDSDSKKTSGDEHGTHSGPDPFDVKAFMAYKVPDAENGAVEIREAIVQVDDDEIEKTYEGFVNAKSKIVNNALQDRILRLVRKHETALELLRRGLAKPKSHFELRPGDDDFGPEPNIGTILEDQIGARNVARLLVLEGALRSHGGDPAAALDSYLDAIRLGRSIETRGLPISALVSIACEAMAHSSIQRLLRSDTVTPAICRRVVVEVGQLAAKAKPASEWLKMEYISLVNTVDNAKAIVEVLEKELEEGSDDSDFFKAVLQGLRVAVSMNPGEKAKFRRMASGFFAKLLELSREPRPEATYKELSKSLGRDAKRRGAPKAAQVLGMLVPSFGHAFEAITRNRCRQSLSRMVAGVRAYELTEGDMPPSAEALVPRYLKRLPTEPYSLKAIRLAKANGKWVVYSVGKDQKDDDGKVDWQWGNQPGDWIVPVHGE